MIFLNFITSILVCAMENDWNTFQCYQNELQNKNIFSKINEIKDSKKYKILVVGRPQQQGGKINKRALRSMIYQLEKQKKYQKKYHDLYKLSLHKANITLQEGEFKKERNALIWIRDKNGNHIYDDAVLKILKTIKDIVSQDYETLISFVDPWPKNRIPEEPQYIKNISYIGDFPITLEELSESHILDETYDLIFIDFHTLCYLDIENNGFKYIQNLLKKEGVLCLPSNGAQLPNNLIENKMLTPLAAVNVGNSEYGIENLLTFDKNIHKIIYKKYQGGGYDKPALKDSYYIFQK